MRYPARFEPSEEGGFVVTFRDIPEAITQGDTQQEALKAAEDALLTAMDFYFEEHRRVPTASKANNGEVLIGLPASAWAKVLLLNEMVTGNIKQADLARLMNTRPQQVTRLVNLSHATKIDEISRAFDAIGKTLSFSVE